MLQVYSNKFGINPSELEDVIFERPLNVYDFIDKQLGKAAPYGVYDVIQNKGWVNVGISSDTVEFAVESIRTWWREMGKPIYVSHFPPGTSKWNKIEHRMFSFISKNWRGKPLIDRATVINLISNTTAKTGLEIKARLNERQYKKGIKVTDEDFEKINLVEDKFHGEWNYSIHPVKE